MNKTLEQSKSYTMTHKYYSKSLFLYAFFIITIFFNLFTLFSSQNAKDLVDSNLVTPYIYIFTFFRVATFGILKLLTDKIIGFLTVIFGTVNCATMVFSFQRRTCCIFNFSVLHNYSAHFPECYASHKRQIFQLLSLKIPILFP